METEFSSTDEAETYARQELANHAGGKLPSLAVVNRLTMAERKIPAQTSLGIELSIFLTRAETAGIFNTCSKIERDGIYDAGSGRPSGGIQQGNAALQY